MHCSSCEPVLDRFLEGTLPPRRMADIAAHVKTCAHCRALLDEVKVVDALLFTTQVPDLPHNFTFAVMADVKTMPPVRAPGHRVWSFLALYSAAAWVALILAIAATGISPAMLAATTGARIQTFSAQASAAFGTVPQASPELAAFGFGILALDAALAALVAFFYFGVRPRLAAVVAAPRRSGHD